MSEEKEETKNYEVVTCECGTVHPVEFSTHNDQGHWNCPNCVKMYLTEELNQRDNFAMKFFIWTDNQGRSLVPNMTASMLLKEFKEWLEEDENYELFPPTPAEKELAEAHEAIKMISSNEHVSLGDLVYKVRDREGLNWEGPSVIAWGAAVDKINAIKERLEA
jgi:hypothetical protein